MDYRFITKENGADLGLKNDPFELFGRLKVSYHDNQWTYQIEPFAQSEYQTFPDEAYQVETINQQGFAIGAYDQGVCIGLAIYQEAWLKYVYLADLKVNGSYRKQGIAKKLIELGQVEAKNRGYRGIYTIGQDNNVAACQFYLASGFRIGGLNTESYKFTSQANKQDIYFYLDN
ncbi:MAG: GNAT family N-acetyltransferase [Enterococcus sp.]